MLLPRVFTCNHSQQSIGGRESILHVHSVLQAHSRAPELYVVRDSMLTLSPPGELGLAWAEYALSEGQCADRGFAGNDQGEVRDPLLAAILAKKAKQERLAATAAARPRDLMEAAEQRLQQRIAQLPAVPEPLKWFGECALPDCGCSRRPFPLVRPSFRDQIVSRTAAVAASAASAAAAAVSYVSVGSGMLLFDLEILCALTAAAAKAESGGESGGGAPLTIESITLIDSAYEYTSTPRSRGAAKHLASLFAPARVVCYNHIGAYVAARLRDEEPPASILVQTDCPGLPIDVTKSLAAVALRPGGHAYRLHPLDAAPSRQGVADAKPSTNGATAAEEAAQAAAEKAAEAAEVAAEAEAAGGDALSTYSAIVDAWERLPDTAVEEVGRVSASEALSSTAVSSTGSSCPSSGVGGTVDVSEEERHAAPSPAKIRRGSSIAHAAAALSVAAATGGVDEPRILGIFEGIDGGPDAVSSAARGGRANTATVAVGADAAGADVTDSSTRGAATVQARGGCRQPCIGDTAHRPVPILSMIDHAHLLRALHASQRV